MNREELSPEKIKEYRRNNAIYGLGWALGVGMGFSNGYLMNEQPKNKIIPDSVVETRNVEPSVLEVAVEDRDVSGVPEFYIRYKDREYLFMEDEEGRPVARDFEYQPSRVVPK